MDMGSTLPEVGSKGGGLKMLSAMFGVSRGVARSNTPPHQRQQATVTNRMTGSASEMAVGRLSTSSAPFDSHELTQPSINYGLSRNMEDHYELGRLLGQGGNAVVVRAVSRRNGREYACKCLPKVLSLNCSMPNTSITRLIQPTQGLVSQMF